MTAEPIFYRDLAYVFGGAVVGGTVARLLRQPLIVGYVLGGIIVGPFTPGPRVTDIHQFEILAEVGVILLMYSIGLEFSFRDLLQVKWVALAGGPLGIVLSMGLALGVGRLLGWIWQQGVAMGAIVSVASTMVLSRFLGDRGQLHSEQGKVMIGITLVEDLAVVVLTILLPTLGDITGGRLLSLGIGLGKALLILIPVVLIAYKLIPFVMRRVISQRDPEFLVLVTLALGFATAAITEAVGLSLTLGAFLAGLLVSESDVAHETLKHLLPVRDAFVALFFVTMGVLVNPQILISKPSLLVVIVVFTVLGKFVIWTAVVWLFRYPLRTAWMVGLGLTQIGEFSYVLVQVARHARLVNDDMYNATLAASVITILLNGILLRYLPGFVSNARLGNRATVPRQDGLLYTESLNSHLQQWVERLRNGDPRALARAISTVENREPGSSELLKALFPHTGRARILGLTGPPGAGKSTLVDQLAKYYRKNKQTVGIIAVDPTSPYSGGAILGDRIRMQDHFADPGIYIRSMATRGSLGGLARTTADVSTVLDAYGRDVVMIETVGVGQ